MIYQCIPVSVERIWGSLPPVKDNGEPVGEIWWFCQDTILRKGDGTTVEAASFFPPGGFPVILKTLHSSCDLSVQVHPGKDRLPPVKDESWAVLEGKGRILHGVSDCISPAEFTSAVKAGNVEEILLSFDAGPGQVFHLPAGTVHALGGGLTVLEIQLNCMITYRLWDYDRRDALGEPRQLHVARGLGAIDWSRFGRADRVVGGFLDAGGYTLEITCPGKQELGALELLYDHHARRCFFSDSGGGSVETEGAAWKVRMRNGI